FLSCSSPSTYYSLSYTTLFRSQTILRIDEGSGGSARLQTVSEYVDGDIAVGRGIGHDQLSSGERDLITYWCQHRCAVRFSDHDRDRKHTSELQSRGHLVCRLLL